MIALDTNVLIYACDRTDPGKQRIALDLISSTREDQVLMRQVACEFIAASRKLATNGFTMTDAWAYLSDLLTFMRLEIPRREVLWRAHDLHLRQCSFWDALIISACIDSGVGRLYSEDLPGGQVDALEIINPFS